MLAKGQTSWQAALSICWHFWSILSIFSKPYRLRWESHDRSRTSTHYWLTDHYWPIFVRFHRFLPEWLFELEAARICWPFIRSIDWRLLIDFIDSCPGLTVWDGIHYICIGRSSDLARGQRSFIDFFDFPWGWLIDMRNASVCWHLNGGIPRKNYRSASNYWSILSIFVEILWFEMTIARVWCPVQGTHNK